MNAPVLVAQLSGSAPQASATPKNLKLEKPQNGQAVTIHLDGNTKLDLSDIASEKLTFVRVGEKLIVLFDNQSTVTVDPVFDSGGHPLADVAFDLGQNRSVTGDEFASLFPITTDQSVLPAAGGNSGPTGGANFSDAHVNALTDPNAPLALLGNENNGSAFGSLVEQSGGAPVASEPFANADLSESNLSGGTAENAGLTTITGFLGVNFGAAASSAVLSFDENQSSLATLRSEGELVNFARVADAAGHFTQLIGFVGADPNVVANRVFIVTLDPTVEGGGYTVTLLRPLDHGGAGADTLNFTLNVTATNQFGSDATEIHVHVQDDVLVLSGDVAAQNVNEDGLADANGFVAGAGATGPVALNIDWGADNDTRGNSAGDAFGRTLSFVADGVPAITGANGEGLSSGGVALQYVVTTLADGGQLLTAYKGAPGENNAVFTLTLDPTSEHGAYSFNLLGTLDHAIGSNSIGLTFAVQAADADGDTANLNFTVNVADDLPVLAGEVIAHNVTEDGLAGANDFVAGGGSTGSVDLNINWGADNDLRGTTGGDAFGRTLSFVADGIPAISGANGAALSSGGVALQYVVTTLADGGQLLTAFKGDARGDDARVFTLTLDPTSEHGAYSFNLLGTLDHAAGSNSIGLTFAVQAADADGDTANLNFTINVADDLPVLAGEVIAHNVTEDGLAGANDFVAGGGSTGSVDLNINWGADNDLRGTVEGDAFGRTLSFVADGIPAISGANGAALSSGGVALQYVVTTLADGGQLLTAFKGDARGDEARVFTLTLDPTSEHGAYSFNLLGTLDHATGSNSIGMTFTVQAADADGDTVDTSFVVNVADDTPVLAGAVAAHGVTEDGLVGANGFVSGAGSTGAIELNINWGADSDTRGNGAGDTFGRTLSFLSGSGSEGDPTLTPLTGSDQPVAYLAFAVSGENGALLSSGGVALQYIVTTLADGGQLLTAYKGDARADDARVFTLTLDPTSAHGSYSFNLLGTLDHATGSDSIGLTFGVQAADADGDTIDTSFVVNVADDLPVIIAPQAGNTGAVDEDGGLAGGNATGPGDVDATTVAVGDLGIHWGTDATDAATDINGLQDGAHINSESSPTALTGRAVYFTDAGVTVGFDLSGEGGQSGPTLTSNGQTVLFRLGNDGTTLEGYVHSEGQESGGDRTVFTVSLSDDGSGAYTFTLLGTLDHPVSGIEDNIALTFNYTARDFDGDTASATFTVSVNDDSPSIGKPIAAQYVDEEGVNGNAGDSYPQGDFGTAGDIAGAATTAGGSLNILWGADAGNGHPNGGFSGAQINGDRSVVFSSDVVGNLQLQGLTSDGVGLQYELSSDGTTLTAFKGGTHTSATEVFQVILSDDSSGSYAFSLTGNLDHPGTNIEDNLTLTFGFTARDGDGDAVSSTFQVIVNDDAPLAGQAASGLVDEDGGFLTGIPGGDGDVAAGIVASGSLGVTWGADNDLKSETLANGTIGAVDDPIGRTVSFAAADGGTALGGTAQFVSGSLVTPDITVTDTAFGQTTNVSAALTSDGVGLSYRLSYHTDSSGHWDGGYVLLAYKSGGDANRASDQVFKVTIDPTSEHGSYKFELLGNLDHPAAGTEDNLNLTFHLVAADADGDQIRTDFTVAVNDDSPITVLNIPDGSVEEEQFVPSGNEDTDGAGDHDLGSQGIGAAVTSGHVDGLLNILWGADSGNSNVNGGFTGNQINGDRSVVFATGEGHAATLSGDEVRAFLSVTDGNLTLDPATMTSRGVALQYVLSADGTTLTAFAGDPDIAHKVFEVKLSDQGLLGTGSYSFDLLDVLDHPVKGNSPSQEDALSFKFTFTARDGDGDSISDHFTVNVSDDSPTIGKPESLSVSESTSSAAANTFVPAEANGSLGIHWGADDNNSGAANRSVAFTEATLDALADLNLRSNGTKITYFLAADDTLLTAKAGGVTVFTVQLSDVSDNGSYTFKLMDNIDHRGNGASVQDLTFGFFATDSDGDTTTPANFTVSVADDVPVAGIGDDATISEKFLLSGTDPHVFDLTVGGKLNIDWNSDDHNSGASANRSVSFAHAIAADNVTVTDANGQPVATALASDGYAVNYAMVGGILYGYTTSLLNPVFLVTLSDSGTGNYTFTLLGNLDHGTGAANYELNLTFSYTATDSDGDPSSNVFTVTVLDDAPLAGVGDHRTANENDLSDGTSPDTPVRVHGGLNIDWGADHNNPTPQGGAHDRSVTFTDNVNAAANVTAGLTSNGVQILYTLIGGVLVGYTGTLPHSAADSNVVFNVSLSDGGDGSYTFTLLGNLDHPAGSGTNTLDLTFNYTATDSDGDSSPNTFTVTVVDDVPLGGQVISNSTAVDEAALLTSSSGGNQISGDLNDGIAANGEVIFGADGYKAGSLAINQTGVTVFDGNGNVETGFVLRSEGQDVKFVSDGTTLYGYVGATHNASYVASHPGLQVFKLVLDPATGGYTFTLLAPLDHTGTANNTDLILGFGLKALDGDSDPVTFTLKLDVTDTVPTVAGGDASSVSESNTRDGTDPLFFGLIDPTSNGVLHVNWGADDNNSGSANRSVAFAGYTADQSATDAGIGSLTSNGQEIHIRVVGTTLYGYTGTAPSNPNAAPSSSQQVFKVELSDSGAGSYKFTLLGNLDHPTPPSGTANDANTLTLHFNYTATDADGDTSAPASFDVTVIDDVLQLRGADHGYVAEGALAGGNGVGIIAGFFGLGQSASGSLGIRWGADHNDPDSGAHDRSVRFDPSLDHANASFTSHGEQVTYSLSPDGLTLTAATASHQPVFTVTLSDNGQGGYTFTLQGPIDHGAGGLADFLGDLSFGFVATDSDGDSKTGSFQVTVIDDVPVAPGVTITGALVYDESAGTQSAPADDVSVKPAVFDGVNALSGLSAIGYASDAVVTVTPHDGADGHLSTKLALTNGLGGQFNGAATNLFDTATGHRIFLYSDASGVVFGRVGSGDGLFAASSGGAIAFAIGIDNSQTATGNSGVLSVVEYRAISHPGTTDANDSVSLKSGLLGGDLLYVTASTTDFDHDNSILTTTRPLTVSFLDDGPSALGVAQDMPENTPVSIVLTEGVNYAFGADGEGKPVTLGDATVTDAPNGFSFDASKLTVNLVENGGRITVDVNPGTAFDALPAGATAVLHIPYTVTDGDGDARTGAITITVTGENDAPVLDLSGPDVAGNDVVTTAVEQLPQWFMNSATISDVDSATMASLKVTLVSAPNGDFETLSLNTLAQAAVTNNGLSWSYDTTSHVLTVTGTAATSVYQSILKGVVYLNNSDNPVTTDRTVHVVVNDGLVDSAQQTATIHLWAMNDPPELAGSLRATMDEGTSHTITHEELGFTDPDNVASEVSFHVSNQVNGVIMLDGVPSLSFTGQQLLDGHVTFVHDGSHTTSATFDVFVEDGNQDGSSPVPQTFQIAIISTNEAPVLAGGETATYHENQSAIVVADNITITDVDSPTLHGATIKIAGNFQAGEDILHFINQNGITGVYDHGTGVLTLSGDASLADYQAALRSVTYSNSSYDPSTADRIVTFVVDDGESLHNLSNAITSTVHVVADPPAVGFAGSNGFVADETPGPQIGTSNIALNAAAFSLLPQNFVSLAHAGSFVTLHGGAEGQVSIALTNANGQALNGLDSGLSTLDGSHILLSTDATNPNLVIGKANGVTVLALAVDPANGDIWFAEYQAIKHGNAGNPNDPVNFGGVYVTLTDGAGDHVTTASAIVVTLNDDAPTFGIADPGTTSEHNLVVHQPAQASGSLGVDFGTDGAAVGHAANPGTVHTFNFNSLTNGPLPSPGNQYISDGFTFTSDQGAGNGQLYGTQITIADGGHPFILTKLDLAAFGSSSNPSADNVKLTGIVAGTGQVITLTTNVATIVGLGGTGTTYNTTGTPFENVSLSSFTVQWFRDLGSNASIVVDNVVAVTGVAPEVLGAVAFANLRDAQGNVAIVDDHGVTVAADALTSGGNAVHYALLNSTTLVGYTGGAPVSATDSNVVFSVVLSQDSAHPNGHYDFTLLKTLDDPQGADSLKFTFSYTAKDGDGDTAPGSFSITVQDDAPAISGQPTLAINEADLPSDANPNVSLQAHAQSLQIDWGADGRGGHLSFATDGNGHPVILDSAGNPLTLTSHGHALDIFTRTGLSGNPQLVGVLAGDSHDTVTPVFVVELNAPVNPTVIFTLYQGIDQPAGNGTLAVTFAIDATDRDGDVAHQFFTVNVTDGGPTASDVAAAISENDTANIVLVEGTDYTFGADTNGHAITLGQATVTDGPSGFVFDPSKLAVDLTGNSGNVTVRVDPGTAFDALPKNATAVLHVPYTVTDGDNDSRTGTINITVTGQNDAAAISGVHTGDVIEDGQLVAQDVLSVADVDLGEAHFQMPDAASLVGTYGAFTFTTDGHWTYSLNNSAQVVQQLRGDQTVTDTLHVVSADGTAAQDITVTIHGANDAPTLIASAPSNDLTEAGYNVAGTAIATAQLTMNDVDSGDHPHFDLTGWSNGAAGHVTKDGTYGTFDLDTTTGKLTYTLDNTRAVTDALHTGDTKTDSVNVSVLDDANASASQTVSFTIHGSDDVLPLTAGDDTIYTNRTGKISILGESLLWNDQAAEHGVLSVDNGQGAGVGYDSSTDALSFTMPNSGQDQNFEYKVIDGSQSSTGDVTVHHTNSFSPTSGDDFFISGSGNGEGTQSTPFNLGGGNDVMFASNAGSSYIDGGAGNDLIVGGNTNMTLRGGTGDDVLRAGNGGTQFLYGDDGNDILYSADGHGGANTLHGGNGDDVLYALGVWNSNFYGDAGKDIIHGSGTGSQLWGGTGASGPDLESDTFAFSSSGWNPDTIRDFAKGSMSDPAVGDRIDLSAILDSALAAQSGPVDLSKFVNVVANGNNATLQVDPSGHSNWQNVAILSGVHTGDAVNLVFEQAQLHQIAVHA